MPKVQLKKQKLNNNNIGRKRIQAKRKIMNKMGEKSDISLKKMNGNGKNTQERGFVAKLPKFNYDENGNTPVRKGAKLPIQNEISKLPVPSFNPDRDEKPHNIISEASTSSIETISTVLIKEPEETFTKTEESICEKPIEAYDLRPVTDIGEEKSSNNNGVKLTIQNKISKRDPDHDEKPRCIISEASNSSIETISTVTATPKIKEPDFFSCIENSMLRKILKNNRYSLEFLSNKLSNEDINSEVGKKIWKNLYERIDKEEDCKRLFYLIKKIATIFSFVKKCDDDGGYLPDNFRECFDENKINYQALCQDGYGPMVKLYQLYDQIGQLKEERLDILNFYEEKKLESSEEDEEQNLDFLLDQDLDVIEDNINKCEIMALEATKAELYLTLEN